MDRTALENELRIVDQHLNEFLKSQKTVDIIVTAVRNHAVVKSSTESKAELFYRKIGHLDKFKSENISIFRMIEDYALVINTDKDYTDDMRFDFLDEIYRELIFIDVPPNSCPSIIMTGIELVNEFETEPSSEEFILNSLLISNVALFENYLRKIFILLYNNNFKDISGSEKIFSMDEVKEAGSTAQLIEQFIARKIDKLMRESLLEWDKQFKRLAHSSVEWCDDELVEIFKRRNAHVHTDGLVNQEYKNFIKDKFKKELKIDDSLEFDEKYLLSAVNRMAKSAMIIAYACGEYLLKTNKSIPLDKTLLTLAEYDLANRTHDLLRENRHGAVIGLFDGIEKLIRRNSFKEVLRVNHLCAMRELDERTNFFKIVEEWDDSALDDEFKLVKLVFQDQLPDALENFIALEHMGKITHNELVTWEALKPLRDYVSTNPSVYRSPFTFDQEQLF